MGMTRIRRLWVTCDYENCGAESLDQSMLSTATWADMVKMARRKGWQIGKRGTYCPAHRNTRRWP
jgi:hypothetical protein